MNETRRRFVRYGLLAAGGSAVMALDTGVRGQAPAVRPPQLLLPKAQTRIETFAGTDARAFLDEHARRNARFGRVFPEAHRRLAARGLSRPHQVMLVTAYGVPTAVARDAAEGRSLLDRLMPRVHAQTVYDSDGYMVASTYNTEGTTWVGNMYFENTTFAAYAAVNLEMDTAEAPEPVYIYEDGVAAAVEGGNNPQERYWEGIACSDEYAIAQKINRKGWQNAWPWIAGAAFACWLSGPGWAPCAIAWGGGAMIGGGLAALGEWASACGCRYIGQSCV